MNASQRTGGPVYFAVIHFTGGEGTAESTAAYMRRVGNSVHAIVDRSGNAVQPVPVQLAAWHAGDHTPAFTGGSRFPLLEQLRTSDFVRVRDVKYRRGYVNGHSVGVELCNRGYGQGGEPPYASATHRNPGVRSKSWQCYTDEQIATLCDVLLGWKQQLPELQFVTGHEDVTNRHTLGRIGGKTDPGPALPWDLVCERTGLIRVAFRFSSSAPGWDVLS